MAFQRFSIAGSLLFGMLLFALPARAATLVYDASTGLLPIDLGWSLAKPDANSFPDFDIQGAGGPLLIDDGGNGVQGVFRQDFTTTEEAELIGDGFSLSTRLGDLSGDSRPVFAVNFMDDGQLYRVQLLVDIEDDNLSLMLRAREDNPNRYVTANTNVSADAFSDIVLSYDPSAVGGSVRVSLNGTDAGLAVDPVPMSSNTSWFPDSGIVWGTTDNTAAGSFAIEQVFFTTAQAVPASAPIVLLLVAFGLIGKRQLTVLK